MDDLGQVLRCSETPYGPALSSGQHLFHVSARMGSRVLSSKDLAQIADPHADDVMPLPVGQAHGMG